MKHPIDLKVSQQIVLLILVAIVIILELVNFHFMGPDQDVDMVVDTLQRIAMGTIFFMILLILGYKDMFQFSLLDIRDLLGTSPFPVDSLPSVVGVDSNTVRLWATDTKVLTRFDPMLWVDTLGGTSMKSTKFVKTTDQIYEHAREKTQIQATPRYRFRLTEVVERSFIATTQSPERLS